MKPMLASPDLSGLSEFFEVLVSWVISAIFSFAALILFFCRRARVESKWCAVVAMIASAFGVWPILCLVSSDLRSRTFPGDNHDDVWLETAVFFLPLFVAAVVYLFGAIASKNDSKET